LRARLAAACLLALTLAGAWAAEGDDPSSPHDVAPRSSADTRLPEQELTEPILYEYMLAEVAAQRGSPEVGAKMLIDLARRTQDPRIARRAVEMSGMARLPDLALDAARLWLEADPQSAQALQTVTGLLVRARRVSEAEPYIERLLAANADSAASGFLQLGRLLAANPDKPANLQVVRRLAAKHADLPEAQLAVSQAALAANDEKGALESVRRAAQLRPGWAVAALVEAQILQKRDPAAAANRLAAYLEQYPDEREVRMSYARMLVGAKRYAEARSQFEILLAAHPNDTGVVYAVGLLAHQLKDYPVAEANFKRLLQLGYQDLDAVRLALGQVAEDQGQWARAIEWYQAVGQGGHYLQSRLKVAQTLSKQGRLDEARKFLRAMEVGEDRQRIQLIVAEAQLLRDANRPREAFEMLGEALKKEPEQPDLLYDIALTAERIERFDVLEEKLRKLIQLRPDHAHAYNALGYSLADRNLRLPEARKLIEKALELAPEDSFIIDSMGWVLYREGDMRGAIGYLRRAYSERPDAEIGAHLGEVLWMSGQRDEAKRVWDEALKNHPDNEALQKAVKRFRP
jgi:tetratricopeptide (TPR) repeat protein